MKGQLFGEATKIQGITLEIAKYDGILGMAFSSIAVAFNPTVFQNMIAQKLVPRPVFGFLAGQVRERVTSPNSSYSDMEAYIIIGVIYIHVLNYYVHLLSVYCLVLSILFTPRNLNNSNGGELLLGGTDTSHYEGNLNFIKLSKETFWQV